MANVYAIKEEKNELYVQIEITNNIWKFLDKVAYLIFNENWIIDEHYNGVIKENDYFSFKKKGTCLVIVMTKKRAHIIIFGMKKNKGVKRVIFKNYSLKSKQSKK